MTNSLCDKCGLRPHSWFTDEGYLCNVCDDELRERQAEAEHAARIDRFRKALMETHAERWSMEDIAEAAHVCANAERSHPRNERQRRELEFLLALADGGEITVNGIPWREAFERLNAIISDPVSPAAVAGPGHVEDVPVSASEPNLPRQAGSRSTTNRQ